MLTREQPYTYAELQNSRIYGDNMIQISTFAWVAIFALSGMVVNTIGIYFIYKNKEWTLKYKDYFMCFAAGILIAAPLLTALPEAISENENAGLAALIGFMFMFFSNKYIKYKSNRPELAFGITTLEGIGIHSFIDGIIYSVTFSVSTLTGILSGLGLVVHEFVEGIITFCLLINGGVKPRKAIFYAFLVSALTTPVGAFIAYPLIGGLNESMLGLSLGFVSGVLIYVSASHLLPEARESERKGTYLTFVFGVILSLIMIRIS